VDPMLAEAGAHPPLAQTPNQRPNPLAPLPPVDLERVTGLVAWRTWPRRRRTPSAEPRAALGKRVPVPEDGETVELGPLVAY
jgi:hypothetical protein